LARPDGLTVIVNYWISELLISISDGPIDYAGNLIIGQLDIIVIANLVIIEVIN